MVVKAIAPFTAFCMASSSTYIINDVFDAKNDSLHPTKRMRPIPAGEISKSSAFLLATFILLGSISLGYAVSGTFLWFIVLYLGVSIAYSMKLKDYPVVDLFCISAGFLFRLLAGGVAFGVIISEWLFLSVFLLAIFLSTGKRLSELGALGTDAGNHRMSLKLYPPTFLEGTMYMTGGAVLVTYTMYVIDHHVLIYTVPLCAFGLLRYIFRVKLGLGGDPTDSLLKDGQLFTVGLLWVIMVGFGIYGR